MCTLHHPRIKFYGSNSRVQLVVQHRFYSLLAIKYTEDITESIIEHSWPEGGHVSWLRSSLTAVEQSRLNSLVVREFLYWRSNAFLGANISLPQFKTGSIVPFSGVQTIWEVGEWGHRLYITSWLEVTHCFLDCLLQSLEFRDFAVSILLTEVTISGQWSRDAVDGTGKAIYFSITVSWP